MTIKFLHPTTRPREASSNAKPCGPLAPPGGAREGGLGTLSGVAGSRGRDGDESIRRWAGPVLLLCQGGARFQRVEDDTREGSFQAADRFASALTLGLFAFEVRTCAGVVARLCDRDPVERAVELTVAAAVQPVTLHAA
jgi:hypothetical protein